MTALLPVAFRNTTLSLINHNGEPFAAMRPIVEGMGLAWQAQHEKLKSTRFASTVMEIVTVAEDGKQRRMTAMPLRKLPGWMQSIHPGKVKPELRETVIAFQNECDDALWAYWQSRQQPQPALPPSKISAAQARTLQEAIARRCATGPGASTRYAAVYRALKTQFRVPIYKDLPAADYAAALALVERVDLPAALPTPATGPDQEKYVAAELACKDLLRAVVLNPVSLLSQRYLIAFGVDRKPRLVPMHKDDLVLPLDSLTDLIADIKSMTIEQAVGINIASMRARGTVQTRRAAA